MNRLAQWDRTESSETNRCAQNLTDDKIDTTDQLRKEIVPQYWRKIKWGPFLTPTMKVSYRWTKVPWKDKTIKLKEENVMGEGLKDCLSKTQKIQTTR